MYSPVLVFMYISSNGSGKLYSGILSLTLAFTCVEDILQHLNDTKYA